MKKYLPEFSNEYDELFDVHIVGVKWLGLGVVRWFDYEPKGIELRFKQARYTLAVILNKLAQVIIG